MRSNGSLPKIGVAGWSYPHWEGLVYPKARRGATHALETVSQLVDAVEIDSSFHQPIRPEYAKLWVKLVEHNPAFQFSAKLHQDFTHGRQLEASAVETFQAGLRPLRDAGKLGAVLMQFPAAFRYTSENRALLLELRRAFRQFPLVAELRHASWLGGEAQGTLIDGKIGFCNIDQPAHTSATPPTALLTSGVGYVRLHGRAHEGQGDYLYTPDELAQWRLRIEKFRQFAERSIVIFQNDAKGKSVVNAMQLQNLYNPSRQLAPRHLQQQYRQALPGYRHAPDRAQPVQQSLFQAA